MRNFIVLAAIFVVIDSQYLHQQDKVFKSIHDGQNTSNQMTPHRQSQNYEPKNHRNQNFRHRINKRLSNIEKKIENMLWYMQRPPVPPQPQIYYIPYLIPYPLPLSMPTSYYENIKPKPNRTEDLVKDLGVTGISVDKDKNGFLSKFYTTERNPIEIDNSGQDLAVDNGNNVDNDNYGSTPKVKETEVNSPKSNYLTPNTNVTKKSYPKINDSHNDFEVTNSKTEKTPAEIDDLDKDVGVTNNKGFTPRSTTTSSSKIYETNVSSTSKPEKNPPEIDSDKDLRHSNKSDNGTHNDKDSSRPVTDRTEISLPKENDSEKISNATKDLVHGDKDIFIPFVVSHEPKPKPAPVEDGSKPVGTTTRPPSSVFLKPGKCHAAIFSCCGLQTKADVQDCFNKYNCAKTFATGLSCTEKIQDKIFETYMKMYSVNGK